MSWNSSLLASLLGAFAPLLLVPAAGAQGTPIGFEEDFALAPDRGAVLEQLIPGTVDYYFYHCLHHQSTGAFDQVEPLLKLWAKRHGRDGRMQVIENRQALLRYDADNDNNAKETFNFLRQRLSLSFNHQRQALGAETQLPTALDPALLTPLALTKRALDRHRRSLDGFRDSAFDFLASDQLDDRRLHSLLSRLSRPDLPNLPALIVRNLADDQSKGFGSLTIHTNLTLAQLDECVQLSPKLLGESAFVQTYLTRLQPGPDVQWRRIATERESYLDRLQAFADRLSPAHNSLKAHVLHHRLTHDLGLGRPDKQRFMAYLRLPRSASWMKPEYLKESRRTQELADMGRDHPTGLGVAGNDEALVRAYFEHFFRLEASYEPYAEYVRDDYLKRVFAETKILAGQGDMERWYSLLGDPSLYEQLEQRVEIEFPPTQPRSYGAQEAVSIDVDLKNVRTLLVKVFEINAPNYYDGQGREVDASIQLDGLIASEERTLTYNEPALRRVRRSFDFPSLSSPGVYVVEFIGNGLSSRAVIRKGRLQYTERLGAAGHVFRVLDEEGQHLSTASVHMSGREFEADESGEILIPYSTDPGPRRITLRHGKLASLDEFHHSAESHSLAAGIFVDREALLSGEEANILVRPSLRVNGEAASLALLEDVVLEISSMDRAGVRTSSVVRDFELHADRDSVHTIQVPADLTALEVSLSGRAPSTTQPEPVTVRSATRRFALNGIDGLPLTSSALLGRTDRGYVLDVLGKNGEPKPDHPLNLSLRLRDYTDDLTVSLQTDAKGRVELGELPGVVAVSCSLLPTDSPTWRLRSESRNYPAILHGQAGETLRVPYQGQARHASRSIVSLLEKRGGGYLRDCIEHVAVSGGFLELRDLTPGDYSLWLKEAGQYVDVRVTAGSPRGGWIMGSDRYLEVSNSTPLHITDMRHDANELLIDLSNAGEDTRVHVFATRYLPTYDPFGHLNQWAGAPPMGMSVIHAEAAYFSGREIGEEYRYILDRRLTKKYPGNMLHRPGLLLNPWALEETNSAIGIGGGAGGSFGGRAGGRRNLRGAGGVGQPAPDGGAPGTFPNLDFLPETPALLSNLKPDAEGRIRVTLADLGPGQQVHAVACDLQNTVYRSLALTEKALSPRDRRLADPLPGAEHYAEQRSIEFIAAGERVTIDTEATSGAQTYDSLADVFQLFQTLSGQAELNEFEFLLRWPELTAEEKRAEYSQHACHELHFFLHEKDPGFFAEVVLPYLANKGHRTFLDDWLLDEDLTGYLDPWAFHRLNIVERILLTRRNEERSESGREHVRELLELLPVNLLLLEQQFQVALKNKSLEVATGSDGWFLGAGEDRKRSRPGDPGAAGPATPGPAESKDPEQARREKKMEAMDELVEEAEEEPSLADFASDDLDKLAQLGRDAARFQDNRALYRAPAETKQYAEHNYWHRRIDEQDASLIGVNAFWLDYAQASSNEPFFSSSFNQAAGNMAEMLMALAVLDLPFKEGDHKSTREEGSVVLETASPLFLVSKKLRRTQVADETTPLLISQNFYRLDDPYRYEGNERRDKFVSSEFLIDVPYGCRVILTNPTPTPRKLELLLQIPEGALPVSSGFETRGVSVSVNAYGTSTYEYSFYFPAPGVFAHYPVHVSEGHSSGEDELVGFAEAVSMQVLSEPSTVDTSSWEYLSQNGTQAQVLDYVDGANLLRLDLGKVAWRLRDSEFFDSLLTRVRDRHAYDHTLWSYGLHHRDPRATREYLRNADHFLQQCGRSLDSTLVNIDAVERRTWQHIEYDPLFNPRAHRFGRQREILNRNLAYQYKDLLDVLAYRPLLDDSDWMAVTYYLLLQDRIDEALTSFAKVNSGELETRLQYDYMQAYMDFFTDDHAKARGIAMQYESHPVERWRSLFKDVLNQLDEAEGASVAVSDPTDRTQNQTALAAQEASLELAVEARQVSVDYQNLDECILNYYEMDIEFLFSTSPFALQGGQQGAGAFAYIKPSKTENLNLPAGQSTMAYAVPAEYQSSNVLVELNAGGITKRQAYYANSLSVQMIENYGQVKVTHADTDQALPKVYVKVFARLPGGTVRFHKDGYTDLRGRFDYASLSGGANQGAERYAMLIMSEEDGAVIREVTPPLQ